MCSFFVSLFVSWFVFLFVCLFVCLFVVCLTLYSFVVCLFVCLFVGFVLFVCLFVRLPARLVDYCSRSAENCAPPQARKKHVAACSLSVCYVLFALEVKPRYVKSRHVMPCHVLFVIYLRLFRLSDSNLQEKLSDSEHNS